MSCLHPGRRLYSPENPLAATSISSHFKTLASIGGLSVLFMSHVCICFAPPQHFKVPGWLHKSSPLHPGTQLEFYAEPGTITTFLVLHPAEYTSSSHCLLAFFIVDSDQWEPQPGAFLSAFGRLLPPFLTQLPQLLGSGREVFLHHPFTEPLFCEHLVKCHGPDVFCPLLTPKHGDFLLIVAPRPLQRDSKQGTGSSQLGPYLGPGLISNIKHLQPCPML